MSGLDNMLSRLESECEKECEAIILEAEKKADAIILDASEKSEKESREKISQAQKEAQLTEEKAKSTVQSNERNGILAAKVSLIEDILNKSLVKLHTLDRNSYFSVLEKLAVKNAADSHGFMYLNERDFAEKPSDFMEKYDNIDVLCSHTLTDDGFILKYGDIEINCTFPAMLHCAKDELKALAAEILFD